MLLTITSTPTTTSDSRAGSATDLGYLLHKHPDRAQTFELPVGLAHVFYPEASAASCTAALVLEVDPIALVRGRRFATAGTDGFSLAQYVNDRPYAASSMLAVALGKVFRTALAGRCDHRPELPERALALRIHIPALPCRGGTAIAERLFQSLGWQVAATAVPLDEELGWGDSRYVDLTLTGELRLADALNQLYVLLPVLDDAKHYWVSPDEVEKLIRAGEGWLAGHPERELITQRYLRHQRSLVISATERLAELDDSEPDPLAFDDPVDDETDVAQAAFDLTAGDRTEGTRTEGTRKLTLADQRRDTVLTLLRGLGVTSVVDLGCGEGKLLRALLAEPAYRRILGVDVSHRSLEIAARRLRLDTLPDRARERITLRQSSLTYTDSGLAGYDAAILMEVIEHIDPPRLNALEHTVFAAARPTNVIVTTPNVEYNGHYDLPPGSSRHPDHRFEWTRAEFQHWAGQVADAHGYQVRFEPVGVVGTIDDEVGPPTQLALFERIAR